MYQMTTIRPLVLPLDRRRFLNMPNFRGMGAARRENAAWQWSRQIRQAAVNALQRRFFPFQGGAGFHQRLRIRMLRLPKHRIHWTFFHQLPSIQNRHLSAGLPDH